MTQALINYLLAINLATLTLSIIDKAFAVRRFWRVPEKFLLALAWLGGALGAKLAQIICGHKKLKLDFSVSLNLIVMFQLAAVMAVWSYQITAKMQDQNISMLDRWMGEEDKPARPKRFGPRAKKR